MPHVLAILMAGVVSATATAAAEQGSAATAAAATHGAEQGSDDTDDTTAVTAAVGELLVRVLGPARAADFAVQVGGAPNTMGLGAKDGKVLLQGGCGVDVASALNWYLNDYANTTYDWTNYEVLLPPDSEPLPLPPPGPPTTRQRQTNYTYYLNTCTFSYSLVWADWKYWQKQIDWAALAGVNLPLASVGVEMTMLKTFARFNVSYTEMRDWFAGPAFLTWFRMGNLQGWGGPLPLSWIEKQSELQVQILARMRGLGMRPVLSAFAGFVPPALVAKHPGMNVSTPKPWNSFNGSWSQHLLEPTEPLFQAIGKVWIEEQTKLYGNPDHIFSADTFTEMPPRSMATSYLASAGAAISNSMRSADPAAVWLCQSWGMIGWSAQEIGAYLGAVPKENMMILLVAGNWFSAPERDYFAGHPYIW